MKQRTMDRVLLGISIGSFLLMSASFLWMPLDTASFIPGLLFWFGLILGVSLQIVLEVRRRAFFASYEVKREEIQKPRNGLLTFGANQAAVIADDVMILSVIAAVLAFIITKGHGFVCYVFIATTTFSFCLHCILNGRIYFHAINQLKVRQTLEQKKEKSIDKGEGENGKS